MAARNRSALIVEDQPFVGLVASDILNEVGLDTYHAHDRDGAIAALRSHPDISVVVADADLEGAMEGVELTRAILREWPDMHVVVTSSGAATAPRGMPEGVALLRKPYSSAQLRALVSGRPLLQEV